MTGRLELRQCLGAGGFGEVYLADRFVGGGLRSEVAVKVLRDGLDSRGQAVQRLIDEARLLAWLSHPNLLKVHELVSIDGRVALVAEYVDGADLDACMTGDGALPAGALCEVMARVADALQAAWTRPGPEGGPLRLLHRDVKPANIRIGRHGEVKLLDFGIAKAAGHERSARTRTNSLVGSFPYVAPERYDSDSVEGPQGDVFSLGCTLYEAVSGRPLLDLSMKALIGLATDESGHRSHVAAALAEVDHPGLQGLLSELLDYDPGARPAMEALVARFEDLAETLPGPKLARWCRSRTWVETEAARGPLDGRTVELRPLNAPDPASEVGEVSPAVRASRVGRVMAAGAGLGALGLFGLAIGGTAIAAVLVVVIRAGVAKPAAVEPPELVGEVEPPPPPPPPVRGPVPPLAPVQEPPPVEEGCGDLFELEPAAMLGTLSEETRRCLAASMRDVEGRSQTDRDALGRVLLVDARAQCEQGACVAWEREQPVFFELVTRSDPDMMLVWAEHLVSLRPGEAQIWALRALERREVWTGSDHVERVARAHEANARAAYSVWQSDARNEKNRFAARNAAAEWAEVLRSFARDPKRAVELCVSAAGTDDGCVDRVSAPVARLDVRFTSAPVGAEVFVDGSWAGVTPFQYPVDHGPHTVTMKADKVVGEHRIVVDATAATSWHWTASGDTFEGSH